MFKPRLSLVVLTVMTPLVAMAARPLVTDDAGVLDRGDCEAEAVSGRDRSEGVTVDAQSLQLGCGVAPRIQVALGASRARSQGERVNGAALLGKASLWEGDGAAVSVSAAVEWVREPAASQRHAASNLTLIHTRSGPAGTQWHFNVGHARDVISRASATSWGIALEGPSEGRLVAMGEVYGDDHEAPWWNLGLRWSAIPERVWLDIGFGRQFRSERLQSLSFGAKLAF